MVLKSGLKVRDTIVGSELLQHDFDARDFGYERCQSPFTSIRILKGDPQLIEHALSAATPSKKVVAGRILTGD